MSYNNIIWCAGHLGKVDLAKRLFLSLSSKSLHRPNVYTYGALMHGFAKSKDYKQALIYLDTMTKQGIKPNQVVFTSAIEACAEAGKYREALQVMDRIKQAGVRPDLTMINTAVKACCLAGAMEEAEELVESMKEYGSMDLLTYHTLMMGHTKLARHQRVLQLYEEARHSPAKTHLDGGVYSLAMLAALNCGMYSTVPRIADTARNEGVSLTEASYTILIQAYAQMGFSDQAIACLDDMVEEGLTPNVISYAVAMAAARDKPDVAVSLLQRMKDNGIEPNTVVLTTAINSLAKGGGHYSDKAFAMLKDMELNGPEPNIYTYNNICRAFAELGRVDDALSVLNSLKAKRLSPDRYTFTTLLIACGRSNSSAMVDQVMDSMKQSGVQPDEIAYGAVIDVYRRAGNSLMAVKCLHEMHKSNIEPNAAHYNLVIRTLRAEGYTDKMFKMVMAISRKEDAKINGNTFEIVMESLLAESRWKESVQLIRVMDSFGFQPSINICVSLVEQLEKARQYKAVFALYRYMVKNGYDFYENSFLNGVFKRLVSVAAKGINAEDLKAASSPYDSTENLRDIVETLEEAVQADDNSQSDNTMLTGRVM